MCALSSFCKGRFPTEGISGPDGHAGGPGNSEDVKKALLNLEMDTPSLVDEKAAAFKDYRVMLTPRVYLLDPAGKILMRGTPDMLFDANLYAVMGKVAVSH